MSPLRLSILPFTVVAALLLSDAPASAQLVRSGPIRQAMVSAVRAARAQAPGESLPLWEPPGFWSPRHAVIVAGGAGAALAGTMVVFKERDLRIRKRRIEALPAGATAEWTSQVNAAKGVERTRNFWLAVAAGVGGATAIYGVSVSPDLSPLPRGGSPAGERWHLLVNPARAAISLARSF